MYSVEILPNNQVYIQPVSSRIKHGAVGVVVFECNYKTALQIQRENL
jgi:hypothetical protein